jgi:hypothetical protein
MFRRFNRLRLVLALLVAAVPARAFAEEPSPPSVAPSSATPPSATPPSTTPPSTTPPVPELHEHWYGRDVLISDAVSATVLGLGLMEVGGTYAIVAGTAGYSLGAPIVHLVHKRPIEAIASFVLRVPAPLIVGGGTALVYCSRVPGDTCGVAGIPPALTLITAAIVVDAVLLSHERVPDKPKPHDAQPTVRVTPTLSMSRRGALVGVAVTL